MIGLTLGHYKILDKLGEGGMGVVYRAEDTTLKRRVALKVLPAHLASNEERLERFQREAETLAALDHPNIVTIHTVEEADHVRFLTMQLVEGKSLSGLIPEGGMALDRIFDLAIPLADALATAHQKGVIHRDLKPANIMVTREGRVKVLDFGLAKLRPEQAGTLATEFPTDTLTKTGTVVGTLPYMSPEQLDGKMLDARSDLFSLGVILYEIAIGRRPFKGADSMSLISAIVTDAPADVDVLRADLPHHLGRIIRRCLEKNPEHRFQTAKDVRNELEDLSREISSGQLQPPSVTDAPASPRPANRRNLAAMLLLAVAIVVAVGLYLGRNRLSPIARAPQPITSIAVLPLQNLSGDPEQEYFADGMTEALITDLAKIGALKVISRTSVMQYKGVARPLTEIARELGVDALVEGSVLHADGRIRISAQLIHAATDQHLWAESYDRDLLDILALQSEVARAIAGEIEIVMTPDERSRLSSAQTIDPAAYEAYLKGRYHWNKRTWQSLQTARDFFLQTIEREPEWALAYAGLADTYGLLGSYGFLAPSATFPQAKVAAIRALETDETISEAHSSLGWVQFTYDWDWPAAEREFQRAIELNPSHAMARHWYALFLSAMGRDDEAVAEIRRAEELDPLSLIIATNHGWIDYFARRWNRAVEQYTDVLELDPQFPPALWKLAEVYGEMGRYEEALAVTRAGMERYGWNASQLGLLLAKSGLEAEARSLLQDLQQIVRTEYISASDIAALFVALDDPDAAMVWLERAFEERDGALVFLKVEPRFEDLREDARFRGLMERMDFPD